MKTVEKIKKDDYIKHYFLWYLKSSFMMPRVFRMVMHPGGIEGTAGIELLMNHQRSSRALITELQKHVAEPDIKYVINEVCEYYVDQLGADKIKELSPELLIFPDYKSN